MLTKETKRRIDTARDILVGQLPLPSDQIELITIALIYKFMDDIDEESRKLGGKATFMVGALSDFAWRKLISNTLSADERVTLFARGIELFGGAEMEIENKGKRQRLIPAAHLPPLFRDIFKNAFLKFRDPQVLKLFLDEINGFTYDHSEQLGNAFEYLLDTMGTQGQNGQFRTPRNIIEFIVDVVDPQKEDTILDPACGTAGFLISAFKHIMAANTSPKAADKDPHAGDLLTSGQRDKLTHQVVGYDITPLMCRLSRVNMYLHHFPNPVIHEYDTLTNKNRWDDKFDVILANPPFMTPAGGVRTHDKFRIAANRAEVLFADFILEHLTPNGRAGFIVPEGIIFQNNDDYISLRKWLVNEAGLWAVVSLPANIFQPYSGVKTSVIFVDRALARHREDILLVKVENDGFSLNTNRNPIPDNDLPAALQLLTLSKLPTFKSEISNLKSPLAHRLVPRADFAKLDAYRAASTAWDFCRKFQVRAERLKTAVAKARAVRDHDGVEKLEKALAKLPVEFSDATGLPDLPDTEAKLRTAFDENIKADAITYGDKPNEPGKLTSNFRAALDNERDYTFHREKYGVTDVSGQVWEFVKFGSVVIDMRNGVNFSKQQVGEGVRFVNIKDVFTPSGIVDCDLLERVKLNNKQIERFRLQDDDLVFVRSSVKFEGTGFPAIVRPRDATVAFCGFVIKCSLDKSRIDPYFAMQLFRSERGRREILSRASRANITNISQDSLEGIEIPLPPIEQQRVISTELLGYQRMVDGCAAALDNYKPQLNIEPDWPLKPISEVARFVSGGTPSKANRDFWTGKIPWVSPKDMKCDRISDSSDHISKAAVAQSATSLVHAGAVLCVIRSGILAHTFPVAVADVDLAFNQDITAIIVDKRELSPEWLFFLLRTFEPDILERGIKRGGTVHSFHNGFLRTFPIPIPPLPLQQAIVADLQREQATLAGLGELKAKYVAKIAARLAAVWGEET